MGWKDYFIYSFDYLNLAAGTGSALAAASIFTDNIVRLHPFSDFEVLKCCYTNTDPRVYVKIVDGSTGRYFTQTPGVDLRTFAGSIVAIGGGSNALIFKNFSSPMMWAGGTPINVQAADFSGSANAVRLSFHGIKYRAGNPPWVINQRNYIRDEYFAYPYEVSLGANATINATIAMDVDADWFVERILCQRTAAATVQLNSGQVGDDWQDKAVHIDNFTGNVAGYNILPIPKYIIANSVLNMVLADLSGSTNVIKFMFEGRKRYFK